MNSRSEDDGRRDGARTYGPWTSTPKSSGRGAVGAGGKEIQKAMCRMCSWNVEILLMPWSIALV